MTAGPAVPPIRHPADYVDAMERLAKRRAGLQGVKRAQGRLQAAQERHAKASDEMREAIEDARAGGCTMPEIADVLGINRQSVYKWLNR